MQSKWRNRPRDAKRDPAQHSRRGNGWNPTDCADRAVCLARAVLKELAVVICRSFFIMFLFSVLGSSFRMLCRVPGPEVNFVTSQAKQMELQVDEGGHM